MHNVPRLRANIYPKTTPCFAQEASASHGRICSQASEGWRPLQPKLLVLRHGYPGHGLGCSPREDVVILGYIDASYGSNAETKRGWSGFVLIAALSQGHQVARGGGIEQYGGEVHGDQPCNL